MWFMAATANSAYSLGSVWTYCPPLQICPVKATYVSVMPSVSPLACSRWRSGITTRAIVLSSSENLNPAALIEVALPLSFTVA
jgi:hypothetical protein